jgi:hypothetical protein
MEGQRATPEKRLRIAEDQVPEEFRRTSALEGIVV